MQGLYYTKNHVTHRKQIQAGHKQALLQNIHVLKIRFEIRKLFENTLYYRYSYQKY